MCSPAKVARWDFAPIFPVRWSGLCRHRLQKFTHLRGELQACHLPLSLSAGDVSERCSDVPACLFLPLLVSVHCHNCSAISK
jgi:hypothetical protein